MRLFVEIAFKNFYKFIFYRNYRIFYWLLIRYGSKRRFQLSKISFYDFKLYTIDALSFIFQYREIFLDESYKFSSSKSNPIIIDCGSNIGMSVLYYKKLYPQSQIICIEADPEIAKILTQNIQLNGFNDVNVISKAAWLDENGVSFSSDGADGGSISENGDNKIPSINFNAFLSSFEKIDFIKIDIEGAEKILIPNCFDNLSKSNNIFLEYHTSFNDIQNLSIILNGFESRGFKYFIKNENKRNSPFVNKHKEKAFDMQLNIFFYK